MKGIGDDGPTSADDRGMVIAFALQGAGDLDRLHFGLESARERAVDHAVEASLEPVEDPHSVIVSRLRSANRQHRLRFGKR